MAYWISENDVKLSVYLHILLGFGTIFVTLNHMIPALIMFLFVSLGYYLIFITVDFILP